MEKLKFVSHPSFSLRFWICPPPPLNKDLYLEYTSVICSIFFFPLSMWTGMEVVTSKGRTGSNVVMATLLPSSCYKGSR